MSTGKRYLNRRELLRNGALSSLGLASLGSLSGLLDIPTAFAARAESSGITGALIAAAKKEGRVNLITLPRDWADYGEIMDTFRAKYGIRYSDAIPEGTS